MFDHEKSSQRRLASPKDILRVAADNKGVVLGVGLGLVAVGGGLKLLRNRNPEGGTDLMVENRGFNRASSIFRARKLRAAAPYLILPETERGFVLPSHLMVAAAMHYQGTQTNSRKHLITDIAHLAGLQPEEASRGLERLLKGNLIEVYPSTDPMDQHSSYSITEEIGWALQHPSHYTDLSLALEYVHESAQDPENRSAYLLNMLVAMDLPVVR